MTEQVCTTTCEDLQIVSKEYMGKKGITWAMRAFVGIKSDGPYRYTFSDGMVFQPYPIQEKVPDYMNIGRGCTDVTGAKWAPYLALIGSGTRSLNEAEFEPGLVPLDIALERIRRYEGPLNTHPNTWPEVYKAAYFETHPPFSEGPKPDIEF